MKESVLVMNVNKAKYIALAFATFGFIVGFSDLQENMFFWMGRPVGAIAFIAYFILTVLEKEYALLDSQEKAKFAASNNNTTSQGSKKETCAPALTTAVLH